MAGLGRRSHYRKHLTDSVLHELPEPDASQGDRIAKVVATRGGNMFEVIVACSPDKNDNAKAERQPQLAILPTKFHKLVWVKRNDFVICRTGEEESKSNTGAEQSKNTGSTAGGGIRYIISHILYKDQVKHLKAKELWPFHDEEFTTGEDSTAEARDASKQKHNPSSLSEEKEELENKRREEDDGIVYNTVEEDEYFLNTNRLNTMTLHDDSSSDESESDE